MKKSWQTWDISCQNINNSNGCFANWGEWYSSWMTYVEQTWKSQSSSTCSHQHDNTNHTTTLASGCSISAANNMVTFNCPYKTLDLSMARGWHNTAYSQPYLQPLDSIIQFWHNIYRVYGKGDLHSSFTAQDMIHFESLHNHNLCIDIIYWLFQALIKLLSPLKAIYQ